MRHLFLGDEQIGISASGGAGFLHQALEGQRALRHAGRMLDHDDIACHQVGRGKACDLVVRKVPGLDTEKHTDGAAFNVCFAPWRGQLFRGQKMLGILGVVVKDGSAQGDFAQALREQLAHLKGDEFGKLFRALAQNGCRARKDGGTLAIAFGRPVIPETF